MATSEPRTPHTVPAAPGATPALVGIRLPLALWVVAHHISGPGRMLRPVTTGSEAIGLLLDDAWVALTIFFAISGFVLSRAYADTAWTRGSLWRYAAARCGRIYPLYLLSLVAVLPFMWAALRSDTGLGGPVARVGLVATHVLLLQAWHWPDVNWNTPAWSLSCEVFFYACAPGVVLLCRRPTWTRVASVAAIACMLPIAARALLSAPPKPFLYVGDFVIGAAAGCAYGCLRSRGARLDAVGPWLSGPACLSGVLLLLFRHSGGSFAVFDTGFRVAAAALVLGLACGGGLLATALSSRPMLAGGQASYALYILHVPVLWWWRYAALDVRLTPLLSALLYVTVATALAQAAHRWYELPADRAIRRWAATPPRREPERIFAGYDQPLSVDARRVEAAP